MTSRVCKRCGACCKDGGPALHIDDLPLLANGHIKRHNLITVREGEPVFSPISGKVEPAAKEFIKISGTGDTWVCCFYQAGNSICGIYEHRPLECRTLKCWDTDELTGLIFKNVITRFDIIEKDDPLMAGIKRHTQECPYENLRLAAKMHNAAASIDACHRLINKDLAIRQNAIWQYNLSLGQELFYFGRPMFQSLSYYGLD
jgi:Fe-S-cluster containining protein